MNTEPVSVERELQMTRLMGGSEMQVLRDIVIRQDKAIAELKREIGELKHPIFARI